MNRRNFLKTIAALAATPFIPKLPISSRNFSTEINDKTHVGIQLVNQIIANYGLEKVGFGDYPFIYQLLMTISTDPTASYFEFSSNVADDKRQFYVESATDYEEFNTSNEQPFDPNNFIVAGKTDNPLPEPVKNIEDLVMQVTTAICPDIKSRSREIALIPMFGSNIVGSIFSALGERNAAVENILSHTHEVLHAADPAYLPVKFLTNAEEDPVKTAIQVIPGEYSVSMSLEVTNGWLKLIADNPEFFNRYFFELELKDAAGNSLPNFIAEKFAAGELSLALREIIAITTANYLWNMDVNWMKNEKVDTEYPELGTQLRRQLALLHGGEESWRAHEFGLADEEIQKIRQDVAYAYVQHMISCTTELSQTEIRAELKAHGLDNIMTNTFDNLSGWNDMVYIDKIREFFNTYRYAVQFSEIADRL